MAQKLRLLLLIPHLGGGGAEQVTALLAGGLSREKYEVHLALVTQKSPPAETLPPWIAVHLLGAARVRSGAFRLLRLVRRLKPDLILSGMAHLNFLVLLLRPFYPRKTRVFVRQNTTVSSVLAFGKVPWYTRMFYRRLYPHANKIICQSRAMADDLAREVRIKKDRIVVLPNPIDIDEISAANKQPAHLTVSRTSLWSNPGPHLLAVGRLAPEKGFDLLLQALALVRQRFPHADLAIAGSGPEESALRAQSIALGLGSAIHFAGYVNRPYELYSQAALFVLSSRYEGMPNALLEAYAGELPIVATPASQGLVDLLQGQPGTWLADNTSVEALAATLIRALGELSHGQRFQRYTLSSGKGHSAGYTFEEAIAAYENLFDSTCARQHPCHVALIIPTLDRIAGAERQVMLIAKGLRMRGWQVSVVALSGHGGATAAELAAAGIAFRSIGMWKGLADPAGWLRFIHWLRRTKPDVVHAHLAHATWLARWSRLFAPIPVVLDTLHSSSTGTIWRRLGYRLSHRLSDNVTTVSSAVASSHLAVKVVNPKNLTVLHNGVDLDDWNPDMQTRAAVRREMSIEDEFLWIAAGRLETVKDYPTLLKAMALLPESAHLIIAGAGPLLSDLSQLATQLNLGGRVCFLGFEPDVKPWFQAADGFVLASLWEGLPMALLEASACELPCVATNVAGVQEVFEDGETGLLVPATDVSALARAMNTIMNASPEERRAMGIRARQRIAARFSLASVIDQWDELYDHLLRKKSSPIAAPDHSASDASCAPATGHTRSS